MTPLDAYRERCQQGLIVEDAEQLLVMQGLQRIYLDLVSEYHKRTSTLSFFHRPNTVKGMYLWGGVGVGKTLMMDCFYHCLPFENKMRMHFHQFVQLIHTELTKQQGHEDPLQIIAENLAKKAIVLCFDELFVSDITDAMLLGRLFKALFKQGVALVTTSNSAPDDLYKNGLQREQFVPAIKVIKENTDVMHISSLMDYRLRHLKEAGVFYTPLDEISKQKMEKSFLDLTQNKTISCDPIEIFGRPIRVIKKSDNIIWFNFPDLCTVPRSQNDYLAIAKTYRTVFVSDIPVIPENAKDTICLFISMVDVFYDARVRLVISAAEPVEQLYSRGYMTLEYTRTHSRLLEMQSIDYFTGEA